MHSVFVCLLFVYFCQSAVLPVVDKCTRWPCIWYNRIMINCKQATLCCLCWMQPACSSPGTVSFYYRDQTNLPVGLTGEVTVPNNTSISCQPCREAGCRPIAYARCVESTARRCRSAGVRRDLAASSRSRDPRDVCPTEWQAIGQTCCLPYFTTTQP